MPDEVKPCLKGIERNGFYEVKWPCCQRMDFWQHGFFINVERRGIMLKKILYIFVLLLCCFLFSQTAVTAQSTNILNGPFADEFMDYWTADGDAVIEEVNGDPCFVLRDGGFFSQEIDLPEDVFGKFILVIGTVSSERINANGIITDLPYFYGYMMAENTENENSADIYAYLKSTDVFDSMKIENEWVVTWDIFPVQDNSRRIKLFLNQAAQRGVPHNGSAARFDDLGVYIFSSMEQARLFVDEYYRL
jgi:hypothetical protein